MTRPIENRVTAFNPRAAIRANTHRKEKYWMGELALVDLDKGYCVATLRTYGTSTGGSNSACLWINTDTLHASGSGSAGGWGYHRPSAAASVAFRSAGIEFADEIGGRGDSAMEDAMRALGAHLGIARPYLHKANP